MKAAIILFSLLGMTPLAAGAEPSARPSQLQCYVGPANREFGGTDWLVYSCSDGRSMVVVSTAKNPAAPFYFVLKSEADGYHVHGEGSGSKQASDAAGDELSRMSAADFANLLADTKTGSKPGLAVR